MGKKKGGKNKQQQQDTVDNTSFTSNNADDVDGDDHQNNETSTVDNAPDQQEHHEDPTTTVVNNRDQNNDDNQQQKDEEETTATHLPTTEEEEEQVQEQQQLPEVSTEAEEELVQEQQACVHAASDVPPPAAAAIVQVDETSQEGEQQQANNTSATQQQEQQQQDQNTSSPPSTSNIISTTTEPANNNNDTSGAAAAPTASVGRLASTSEFNAPLPIAEPRPFGKVIGFGKNGCPAFSCGLLSESDDDKENNNNDAVVNLEATTPYGVTTGRQWSSVEYVRRWTLMARDTMLPHVTKPADVWFNCDSTVQLKHMNNHVAAASIARYQNHIALGDDATPQTGDIIIWDCSSASNNSNGYPLGHVAVVFDVDASTNTITIGEQGVNKWEKETYSRQLKMSKDEVSKMVSVFEAESGDESNTATTTIIGWIRVLAPFLSGQNVTEIADRYRHVVSKGTLTRTPFEADPTLPWLDRSVPWDNFQIQSFSPGGNIIKNPPSIGDLPSGYYTVDYDLWMRSRHLTENLHRLMYDTSRRIIMECENSEKGTATLEKLFGIPRALHPLLRQSLEIPCITGRFDLGFDGATGGLKVFEYNCDSSSCLLETVESQEKIAKHYKFDTVGQSGGLPMQNRMEWWWREFARVQYPRLVKNNDGNSNGGDRIVHFMVDDDPEERYTALCMMEAAKAAKFKVQMCVKFVDFRKMENGDIVDLSGNVVQCVWKTWSWDTVLTHYAKQQGESSSSQQGQGHQSSNSLNSETASSVNLNATTTASSASSSTRVTLLDILLNPNIVVFEPFWKFVCGSKGLLPYLHQADPENEFLLKAFFEKDASISKSFVRKPVSGRTGANITVHDETDVNTSATKEDVNTGGRWGDGQFIYQEKMNVTVLDGNYPTVCAWCVGNAFGGMVVREGKHLVTQLESPVCPVRVKRESSI